MRDDREVRREPVSEGGTKPAMRWGLWDSPSVCLTSHPADSLSPGLAKSPWLSGGFQWAVHLET